MILTRDFVLSLSLAGFAFSLLSTPFASGQTSKAEKPNILFIAVDDLNDWVGCLGGHPQASTPNLDRLAKSGVLFTNAHCVAPACNPSRTAIFTGISPKDSGFYRNEQNMRAVLPDVQLMPDHFRTNGYRASGSGKMLHYFIDAQSWDEYFPAKETENPFPKHIPWGKRPKSLPRAGQWQYSETDWHPFDVSDEEFGGDYLTANYVANVLSVAHPQPFFLACGLYRPHEPWFNPKKYFDQFPIETVQLPPGYLPNDLDDLPDAGKRRGPNRYFDHIRKQGQWREGIRAYLASIAFMDANLGTVLDALDAGPNRGNTIVCLWSDHGWHLGEKQHWQKFTAWRTCTRVPLILRVPPGTTGLPQGTVAGSRCGQPVDLLSLFPTLTRLCGLTSPPQATGKNLIPLLQDANADWSHLAFTYMGEPGTVAISGKNWRYIRYANGDEELYDISKDPYEWNNLAEVKLNQSIITRFRNAVPRRFQPLAKPPASK